MNSRVNLDNQAAVILHQYNYRNNSLIIHFFLSNFGKVSAIAKGVKGQSKSAAKRNPMALFQPFQKLLVSLTGKHDLLTLKNIELNCEADDCHWKFRGKSLYCAYYINELLLRLLPSHIDCQEIFQCYHQALNALLECSETENSEKESSDNLILYDVPLRFFECDLLELLGYGLNLIEEVSTGNMIDIDRNYFYLLQSGPSVVKLPEIKQLHISGSTLYDLANRKLITHKSLQESKLLLRWAINEHLGDKPLKSRELFKQLYC